MSSKSNRSQRKPVKAIEEKVSRVNLLISIEGHAAKVPAKCIEGGVPGTTITIENAAEWVYDEKAIAGGKSPYVDLLQFLTECARFHKTSNILKVVKKTKGNLEAKIHLLRVLKWHLDDAVIETMMDEIPICTDEARLLLLIRTYPWYIVASRRAVTLAHYTKPGLSKKVVEFIGRLAKTSPALAFALSPTTLHDNTLVSPQWAPYFTCDPFARDPMNEEQMQSSYKPIIDEATLKDKTISGEVDSKRAEFSTACSRMQSFTECLMKTEFLGNQKLGSEGECAVYVKKFPWTHPSIKNCGAIIAGGLVCASILSEPRWLEIVKGGTDIDIFAYGDTENDRKSMVFELLHHFNDLGATFERFKSVIKVKLEGAPDIQIVCPYARSPLGVLINFDSTFIQIGYQGSVDKPFFATPGHCFFTPRNETLITRYNVRMFRIIKMLQRGFTPVSDERGHYIYPKKLFVSSRWPMRITNAKPMDAASVDMYARRSYMKDQKIRKTKGKPITTIEIDDKPLFEIYTKQAQEMADEKFRLSRWQISVPSAVEKLDAKKSLALTDAKGTYTEDADLILLRNQEIYCSAEKPVVEWEEQTLEELEKTFDPESATLSNGFDIYTKGVNSTLPLPEDGDTEDIHHFHVLLRNIRVLPAEKEYNLAAPKSKPLMIKHAEFQDPNVRYPGRVLYKLDKEPHRKIEGVFVFADPKQPEEKGEKGIVAASEESEMPSPPQPVFTPTNIGGLIPDARQVTPIVGATPVRLGEDVGERLMGAFAPGTGLPRPNLTALFGQPQKASMAGISSLMSQTQKPVESIKRKEETDGSTVGANPLANAIAHAKAGETPVVNTVPSVLNHFVGSEPVIQNPFVTSMVKQPVDAPVPVPLTEEQLQAAKTLEDRMAEFNKKHDQWMAKMKSLQNPIGFDDLHRYVAEDSDLATISMEEMPMLIKAFAKGGKIYTSTVTGQTVRRAQGMVKITAVIAFSPCMIFDVDDLLLSQRTLDLFPERRYNGVVALKNISRWMIKAHEHKDVLTNSTSRTTIIELLREELIAEINDKQKKARDAGNDPNAMISVPEFLRAIRMVANAREFEEVASVKACTRPHPEKGLLGEMPILSCTRLYVTKHKDGHRPTANKR